MIVKVKPIWRLKMEVSDLGGDDELSEFVESELIALVDADTVAYAAACNAEHSEELLPREMYSDEEWEVLMNHPGYYALDGAIWHTDIPQAIDKAIEDIQTLVMETDCRSAEVYFTTGTNFRFQVAASYKANRKEMRYPQGLKEIKLAMLEKFPGEICEGFEADDRVVQLKQLHPEKYVLCAVDKDVLGAVAGKHYNYYKSAIYKIKRKWVEVTDYEAFVWPFKQVLMGDTTDNIKGCPGIGKVKAAKALGELYSPCEMWKVVVSLFNNAGRTKEDAITDMRLIHMHQLKGDTVVLWEPPCDVKGK